MKTAFRSHKCDILNVTDREKKHHQLILKVSKSEKPKKGSFFFALLWAQIKRDGDVSCILHFEHLNVAA